MIKISAFNSLNKTNMISGAFSGAKRPENSLPVLNNESKSPKNKDTVTIFGKEVAKKTAALIFGALVIALASVVFAAIYNIKKGKGTKRPLGDTFEPKIKPNKEPKAKPDIKPKPKAKPKAKPVSLETKQAAPVIKSEPDKFFVPLSDEEIKIEALKRINAKKNAEIAQDYFFDLNDKSCGKSAEESARAFARAFQIEEDCVLRMANKIGKTDTNEKTPENIKAVIETFANPDVFVKKVDETIKISADSVLDVLYQGPSIIITKDGRMFTRWFDKDGTFSRYLDLTRNFINRAKGRNFAL